MVAKAVVAPPVEQRIVFVRGEKVLLDRDLAELYGVETKALNQAVRRNAERFPKDFMFQLSTAETENLRFQIGTSSSAAKTSSRHGGRRYLPYVFTEQGVAMLSSVLNSRRAIMVNIEIMRAFVRLRQLLSANAELARKLDALEQRSDAQFKAVFDAIRELMAPAARSKRPIGFVP
jgi:hypothetical protein